MSEPRWSALRSWWIRDQGFSCFKGGENTGKSIAALKVLLAISLLASFKSGRTKSRLLDLEQLTGLSRPMVLAGVKCLERNNILNVNRGGSTNEYILISQPYDKNWGKIPYDRLDKELSLILNRGVATLAALKIYMLLVSLRPNKSLNISISHEHIRERTNIQTKHVKPALDILINHSLISIDLKDGGKDGEYQGRHNVYTIKGIALHHDTLQDAPH